MKKVILLAAAMLSFGAVSAQHVIPVEIETSDLMLDSIRMANGGKPEIYLVELSYLQKQVNEESDAIKEAYKQLKEENKLYKSIESYLGAAQDILDDMDKQYQACQKAMRDMQSTMDKEQTTVRKLSEVDKESKDNFQKMMSDQQREMEGALSVLNDRLRQFSKQQEVVAREKQNLATFALELEQKETSLKSLEQSNKIRMQQIKNEQKLAKKGGK